MCVPGGGEAVRPGRPDVRRVPGGALRGEVCPLLLCQCHLSPVLLRILLGHHSLTGRQRVPQTPGERGGRPAAARVLSLELSPDPWSSKDPMLRPWPPCTEQHHLHPVRKVYEPHQIHFGLNSSCSVPLKKHTKRGNEKASNLHKSHSNSLKMAASVPRCGCCPAYWIRSGIIRKKEIF